MTMRIILAVCSVALSLAISGGAGARAAAGPDLTVSQTARFVPVNTGADETFTATVVNVGTADAPFVVVTDPVPNTMPFLSDRTSQGACAEAPSGQAGQIVTCNLGTLPANATATISITAAVSPPPGSIISNTFSAQDHDLNGTPLTDPTPADDSATLSVNVVSNASAATTDIQVTGSTNNGGPKAGTTFTLTWQVKNNQDQTANGVTFSDSLPSDLTFESASASMGTCTVPAAGSAGGAVSCTTDGLAKGQTQVIAITVQAGSVLGNVSDTGSATFFGTDTNPANNSFTVTVKIQ
jgi:uncharacterized repeat protein (TIGR01451 family)